jgi:hypothetical protein
VRFGPLSAAAQPDFPAEPLAQKHARLKCELAAANLPPHGKVVMHSLSEACQNSMLTNCFTSVSSGIMVSNNGTIGMTGRGRESDDGVSGWGAMRMVRTHLVTVAQIGQRLIGAAHERSSADELPQPFGIESRT